MTSAAAATQTDAIVIGAGPVGLFQVFELGLLRARAHVIEALPQAGGQPLMLYPDKPVYDIPAIAVCSGQELIDALLRQIAPFEPRFHFGHTVSALRKQADGRFCVETAQGLRLAAPAVFIAAGAGAFLPRPLKLPGIEAFEGKQLFYRLDDPARLAGQAIVINGGAESALSHAVELAAASDTRHRPRSVTLLHRRAVFQASAPLIERVRALCASGQLQLRIGQITGFQARSERLAALEIIDPDGATSALPLDGLLVLQGLSPRLGPVAEWGLAMERKQLVVNTETYGTSEPGIFAVGDVNTYPGKKKLMVCGFHEATLAAYGALPFMFPGQEGQPLQYTSSNARLHQLLGAPRGPGAAPTAQS
jgi:thioredoxin reductase (NADPH)